MVLFPFEYTLSVSCSYTLSTGKMCVLSLLYCHYAQCRGSSFIVSILFFCICRFLCACTYMECDVRTHSPILFSGYIKFIDPSRTFAARSPFINESHKSWIFILIKWTSHFAIEERIKNANCIQNSKQANILLVLYDFNWIGI